jgi:hypothetical protein
MADSLNYYISLLYSLSSLSGLQAEQYVTYLKKHSKYLNQDMQKASEYYTRYYEENRSFPDFSVFLSSFGLDTSVFNYTTFCDLYGSPDDAVPRLWSKLVSEVESVELNELGSQLISENDTEKKRLILSRYTQLMMSSSSHVSTQVTEDTCIDPLLHIDANDPEGLVWPVELLNTTFGHIQKGQNMVLVGGPGSFKTSVALNIVFQNSVLRPRRCAYVYLEDRVDSYYRKLLARFSSHTGDRIDKDVFLKGTSDESMKLRVKALHDRYQIERKGAIFFVPASEFSSDPIAFANQFGRFVDERAIDYVVFDYAQRMRAYAPSNMNEFTYLNHFFTTYNSLALGMFKNKPFASIILSQLTKEGVRKIEKTKGRISKADAAEISALERDAFGMVSLFANDSMKAARQMVMAVIKARNGETFEEPVAVPCDPNYVFIGDVHDLDDTYTMSSYLDSYGELDL